MVIAALFSTSTVLLLAVIAALAFLCAWMGLRLNRAASAVAHLEDKLTANRLEREKLQQQLSEHRQQLSHRERLVTIGKMSCGLVHDLNNALTPVVAIASLLEKEQSPGRRRELGDLIQAGTRHTKAAVARLQTFCRKQSDNTERVVVSLRDIVDEAVELTRFRWHHESKTRGVQFDVDVAGSGKNRILGQLLELVQLVTNLISNSIDAMPEGGRIIVAFGRDREEVVLVVSDEGTGMTDEVRARCFEPFFSTKEGPGSGMGLSVCHGIVESHRGSISAVPNESGGTQIVVRFPAFLENTDQPTVDSTALCLGAPPAVQNVIDELLGRLDIGADHASDLEIATVLAEHCRYRWVIVDDLVIVANQSTRLRDILRRQAEAEFILIASDSTPRRIEEMLEVGTPRPKTVLQKPLDGNEFADAIRG